MRLLTLMALLWAPTAVQAKEPRCPRDVTLSRAAAELLMADDWKTPKALSEALRVADSDAVGVKALWVPRGEKKKVGPWLKRFRATADAPAICGEAITSDGTLMLITANAGRIDPLKPKQKSVHGWLAPGFRDAELVVSDRHGNLRRTEVSAKVLKKGVALQSDLERPLRVQLVARGSAGPRPVAERVVPNGSGEHQMEAEPGAPLQVEVDADEADESYSVLGALRRLRGGQGLTRLRDNQLLAKVAQTHARKVCMSGRVAHELQPGADPELRLQEAGVAARRVGETVARSTSVARAFVAIERSPSHRMTLLEKGFTDVGVGRFRGEDGKSCLVLMLASWPRYIGR